MKKLWKNKWKILEGLLNRLFPNAYVERIYKERLDICMQCPSLDLDGDKCYVPGTAPCCGECGCELATKLRSLSSECGDEKNPKWHAVSDVD
jgi:hypothetical protein